MPHCTTLCWVCKLHAVSEHVWIELSDQHFGLAAKPQSGGRALLLWSQFTSSAPETQVLDPETERIFLIRFWGPAWGNPSPSGLQVQVIGIGLTAVMNLRHRGSCEACSSGCVRPRNRAG